MKRRGIAVMLALVLLVAASSGVSAHTPTAGASDQYPQDSTLQWHFVAGEVAWPTYAATAVREAINHDANQLSDWAKPAANQSSMPDYDEVSTGRGLVIWCE